MKKYLPCFLLFLLPGPLLGQSQVAPGGVKSPISWYVTDSSAQAFRSKLNPANNLLYLKGASSRTQLNFHPSLELKAGAQLIVPFDHKEINKATFFTVYQCVEPDRENTIWHLSRNQKTELVLTTHRMADLNSYEYLNYVDVKPRYPKVNTYVQNKSGTNSTTEQTLIIGSKPVNPSLPIQSFSGLVPEIIAYDRVLTSQERLKVASYLALKYGITLSEPAATYVNSTGETIWSGQDYSHYHHNIAGIGRDDSSGLYQFIASSSNEPGLLTVSAADRSLKNNSFLLWGDNGKELREDAAFPGAPVMLEKKWLIVSSGNSSAFKADVIINTKKIDASLPAKPVYWLLIDRSGTGKFPFSRIEYKRMARIDNQGFAFFNGVDFGKDSLKKEIIAIIPGQELLLATEIKQPACSTGTKGSLTLSIHGGKPPFALLIRNEQQQVIHRQVYDDNGPIQVNNINAGRYSLLVNDANQNSYKDFLIVNHVDGPPSITYKTTYFLNEGSSLEIKAPQGAGNDMLYAWSGPDHFSANTSTITVNREGIYTVTMTRNGCSSQQDIRVKLIPKNIFSENSIVLFPNPSPGAFIAKVSLATPAAVTMELYDAAGKRISVHKGEGMANYRFSEELKASGTYRLVFLSGPHVATRSLIIAK